MGYFLMLADDFTGAADAGVQMTKNGLETHIVFDAYDIQPDRSYVIDSETRNLSGREAYDKVKNLLLKLEGCPFEHYYKKIDSTIRGNIHEELKAAIEVIKPDLIVFNPGNPGSYRTVENGVLMMNGVRILETEIARDPLSRVKEDHLKTLLEQSMNEPVRHFTLEEVRNEGLVLGEERIISYDMSTGEDIEKVVRFVLGTDKKVLWVGSAGMANVLVKCLLKQYPVLALIGSISETSRIQVEKAVENGAKRVTISIPGLLKKENDLNEFAEEAVKLLNQEKDVVVVTAKTREDYLEAVRTGESLGMSPAEVSRFTQEQIGILSTMILSQTHVKGLFLTGGDTAISVSKANHASGAKTQAEILPIVALVRLDGGDYPGLPCIVKGGAIGDEDTLVKSIQYIRHNL